MSTVVSEGLRERKKRETRAAISATATALFARHGFEQTTIVEVAREAGVAKMTVTNYFPLKEDLVFDRREEIVERLAGAVGSRPDTESVLDAVRRSYADGLDDGDPTLGHIGPWFAELVQSSPALVARERVIFAEQERALADALSTAPGDIEGQLAAAQLAAVFRLLYFEARRRLLEGADTASLTPALAELAQRSYDAITPALPSRFV